jgi:hypothetical protein
VHKVKLHAKVNFKVLVTSQSRRDRLSYTISENKVLLNRRGNPLKGLKGLNIPIVSPSRKKNTISKKRPVERSSTRIAASKRHLSKLVTLEIPSEVTPLSSQATRPQATKEDGILEAASSSAGPQAPPASLMGSGILPSSSSGPQATPSSAGPHATYHFFVTFLCLCIKFLLINIFIFS